MGLPLLRRLTAILTIVCLAIFSVESGLADVHQHAAALTSVQDPVPHASAPADAQAPQGERPGQDTHPVHVCHCSHAHTVGVVMVASENISPDVHRRRPDAPPRRPLPSRSHEPLVRPPIA